MSNKITIVAEAGVNHNGSIEIALDLVENAGAAGADFVKFQTFESDKLVSRFAEKSEYQKIATGESRGQLEMLQSLELSHEEHYILKDRCARIGIQFLSAAFDAESIEFLATIDIPFVKIPSGEITNLPYLRKISSLQKPTVLSTGMASLSDIDNAVNEMEKCGLIRENITLLHCNTEYPTPFEDVNLKAMCAMGDAFGVAIGYSDHTTGIEVPIAAAALGAVLIEKHFTLSRKAQGPDHSASLEPDELKAMVTAIRNIEKALGSSVKKPSVSELKNIAVVRKSIVASRSIKRGEKYSDDNLAAKRPGHGISPMRWDEVLGRVSPRDYEEDEMIEI